MKKFSSQLIFTTLSKTTKQLSIFTLSIILARYFSKADYGSYLHVQMIANVAIWSLLLGIPHSIYYFLPKVEQKKRFILTTFTIILTIALLVSGLVMLNAENLSSLLVNPELQSFGLIMAALVFFQIPLTIFEPLMISLKKVSVFVTFDFTFNLAFFVAVLTPICLNCTLPEVLQWLVWFYFIQFIVMTLICIGVVSSLDNEKNENEVGTAKIDYQVVEQFKYSLPIGGALSVAEASRYADKVIVSNQFSPEEFAVYARGAMNIPVVSIIANTLDNLLMPKFIEAYRQDDTKRLIQSWHSAMRMMAAFIYPACFFLVFVAPWLIPALFSEKYLASVAIFQIFTLRLLTRISTFNIIFRTLGKTKAMLWLAIGSLMINIVITYFCIQLYGVKGAALSCVLLSVFMLVCSLKIITRYLSIEISQVLPWRSLIKTALASVFSLIPIWLISQLSIAVWPMLAIMVLVYGGCYFTCLKFTSALNESEKVSIRTVLPNRLSWVI